MLLSLSWETTLKAAGTVLKLLSDNYATLLYEKHIRKVVQEWFFIMFKHIINTWMNSIKKCKKFESYF